MVPEGSWAKDALGGCDVDGRVLGEGLDLEETVTGATVVRLALEVEEKHGTIS